MKSARHISTADAMVLVSATPLQDPGLPRGPAHLQAPRDQHEGALSEHVTKCRHIPGPWRLVRHRWTC